MNRLINWGYLISDFLCRSIRCEEEGIARHINSIAKMIEHMKFVVLKSILSSLKILVSTKASSGMTATKLAATFKVALLVSPISMLTGLENWFQLNYVYVNLVSAAILIDWFLGTVKHALWFRDFHWLENIKGLFVKIILVLAIGFVVEGMDSLTEEFSAVVDNLMIVLRLTVFLYPVTSIVRSSRVISDGKFPPQKIYDWIENWTENITKK